MTGPWLRTLSVLIRRSPKDVYEYVSRPRHLPEWAAGLGRSVRRRGADWVVETPAGPARIRFAPRNKLGILDQVVTFPSGASVYVPMRVVPGRLGSEVLFTLIRQPGMTGTAFARDTAAVRRDLRRLKKRLEMTGPAD
jgi:hypothetical protein